MASSASLASSQSSALAFVTERARSRAADARQQSAEILRMSDVSPARFEQAVSRLQDQARVALHFHPDRPGPGERSVAASLLADGIYRSQFETGISNGGLSAHLGGARHRWETQIFGAAYEKSGFTPAERPKYGALDLMLHPDGPSPRSLVYQCLSI